jgi:hypothetical protein
LAARRKVRRVDLPEQPLHAQQHRTSYTWRLVRGRRHEVIRRWQELPEAFPNSRAFECDGLRVFVALEGGRLHLSISARSGRYPTWDEIADARYDLLPDDRTFAMFLPPPAQYVNVSNVFHLWETFDTDVCGAALGSTGMLRTYESGLVSTQR